MAIVGFSQKISKNSTKWTTFYSNSDISIASKYVDCNMPEEGLYAEQIHLQFTNHSKETLKVTWYNDTFYNGKCTNCDHTSRDRQREIIVPPKTTTAGKCKVGLNVGLEIHSKWLQLKGQRELDHLVVSDIQITKADLK